MSSKLVFGLAACLLTGSLLGCGGKSGPAEIPQGQGATVKPGEDRGMSIGTVPKPADKKK